VSGGRRTGYGLRLSVIDGCNFRCRYCRPHGAADPHGCRPPVERLECVTGWLAGNLGARRVRLTGGEPLVRADVVEIVARLARLRDVDEVSLTTNGARLAELAEPLARAGLRRVNVSLDSVDPDRFATITGGGRLERTIAGIEAALAAGLTPLKLNAVLVEPGWREDLPELLAQAARWGVELRLIELMAVSTRSGLRGVRAGEVREWLARRAEVEPLRYSPGAAARSGRVRWRGASVDVGWITPVSEPFCGGCDRLRVDAAGRLRRCLMDPQTWPLAKRLEEADEETVLAEVRGYLAGKSQPLAMRAPCTMDRTGG
jgi:cyclic pyranopterin phosphate synthase